MDSFGGGIPALDSQGGLQGSAMSEEPGSFLVPEEVCEKHCTSTPSSSSPHAYPCNPTLFEEDV